MAIRPSSDQFDRFSGPTMSVNTEDNVICGSYNGTFFVWTSVEN